MKLFKHKFLYIFIISLSLNLNAQEKTVLAPDKNDNILVQTKDGKQTEMTVKQAKAEYGVINENVSFGLSLGFNTSLESIKTAQISPIDNQLLISDGQKGSFVLSTAISVPISFKKKMYRRLDKNGKEVAQLHTISDFSIVGIVNLVTLSEAQTGSIFNQKISGGLGISYNFDKHVAIALTYELISYRKPKEFLLALEGSEVKENGTMKTTIDISDNIYYFDRYASALSLKIIYKLTKS